MIRRARKTTGIPVLKLPPARLLDVVLALRNHEYDRSGFRLSVMQLFADDVDEKSAFRGMAIPTLRGLGLLLGFEASLHLSSDGALVAAGADQGSSRPIATILCDIEEELGLLSVWRRSQTVNDITDDLCQLDATGTPESRRRAQRWISYLEHFEVVTRTGEKISRATSPRKTTSCAKFSTLVVSAYRLLSPQTIGEPAVVIDDIARVVMLNYFQSGKVLTRRGFDKCLTQCVEKNSLPLHLHRSMGAGQKLFRHRDEVYESLSLGRHDDV